MSVENVNTNRRLQELSGSDYEVADGQPDIRGWDVANEAGSKIGKVKELLFDETSRKVRYLIVNVKDNSFDIEKEKVLVPIGVAQLHENNDDVVLPGVTAAQLQLMPEYEKDSLTPENEHSIRNVFAGIGGAALASASPLGEGDDFYNHDHFNEDNLYRNRGTKDDASEVIPVIQEELQVGKREVETGGIRLRSRVVEKPVEEEINLRQEKVTVERTAVDRPAGSTDIREDSIELIEHAEVPVVSKDARVVEEISLNKDVTEREETVSDTVKNTEVDIERTDKDGNIISDRNSF